MNNTVWESSGRYWKHLVNILSLHIVHGLCPNHWRKNERRETSQETLTSWNKEHNFILPHHRESNQSWYFIFTNELKQQSKISLSTAGSWIHPKLDFGFSYTSTWQLEKKREEERAREKEGEGERAYCDSICLNCRCLQENLTRWRSRLNNHRCTSWCCDTGWLVQPLLSVSTSGERVQWKTLPQQWRPSFSLICVWSSSSSIKDTHMSDLFFLVRTQTALHPLILHLFSANIHLPAISDMRCQIRDDLAS